MTDTGVFTPNAMTASPATSAQTVASLIGVCRENRRNLAEAVWTVRSVRLRSYLLDALDQCSDMLADLARLAPEVPAGDSIQTGWHTRKGGPPDDALAQVCAAGEEFTLRAAQTLWAEAEDRDLRRVLQVHIIRMTGIISGLRTARANIQTS